MAPIDDTPPPPIEEALAHAQFVRAMARSVLGRDPAVEDAVQETWLVAMHQGPRDRASMKSWLGTVARNVALSIRRSTSRRAVREEIAARAEALPSAERIVEVEDARRRLVHAVLALDEPYRSTVLLRYYTGLTPADIAGAQGVPIETVRTRLQRGLGRLRERFAADHAGDRRSAALALMPLAFPDGNAPVAFPWAEVLVVKKFAAALVVLLLVSLGVGVGNGWIGSSASDDRPVAQLAPGVVVATDSGLAAAPNKTAEPPPGSPSAKVERARVVLSGRVVDENGQPVALARVWTAPRLLDEPPDTVRTASDGQFHVEAGPRDHIFAVADGCCVAEASTVGRGGEHEIVLYKTVGVIRGRVIDSDGRPIAGARIVVGSWQGRARNTARSGAGGQFEVPGTPLIWGDSVNVSAAGFLSTWVSNPPGVAGGSQLVVRLERAGAVTGRVFDASTGAAIPEASVQIVQETFHLVKTDAEGRFRLDADVGGGGKAQVRATADGHRAEVIDVSTRGDADVELRLEPLATIEGRVLDIDGRPAAGAELRATWDEGTRADADGRFRLACAAPSAARPLVVVARWPGRGPAVMSVTDSKPIELRLVAAATVTGTVIGADGAPVASALVELGMDGEYPDGTPLSTVMSLAGFAGLDRFATDEHGRFVIDGLPAGHVGLRARRPGSDRGDAAWFAKAQTHAGETTEVEIRAAGGRTLSGEVVDDEGQAVAFAEVLGDGDRGLTDRAGRFTLHLKPANPTATTWVMVQTDGYEGRTEQVLPDAKELRFVVPRWRTIKLRLEGAVPPDGTIAHVAVQSATGSQGHGAETTVNGGEVTFSGVGGDAMSVYVRTPSSVGGPVDVIVDPTTRVGFATLRLERAMTVTGVVADEARHAIRGASVTLMSRSSGVETLLAWSATTANDGQFLVDGVPTGSTWLLSVGADGFAPSTPLDVRAGAADVRVALARSGGVIVGRVVVPDGDGAVALRVDHRRAGATSSQRMDVAADGRFRISNLEWGRHVVAAVRGQRPGPEQTIDLSANGAAIGVDLLAPEAGLSIRGRFVDARGAPWVFPSLPPSLAAMAGEKGAFAGVGEDGRFEIIGLEPGDYALTASLPGGHASLDRVRAGSRDVALRWIVDGAILGRVLVPLGASENTTVAVIRADGVADVFGGSDATDGRFHIRVAPGRYRVLARSGAFVGVSEAVVEVAEDAVAHAADVVLVRGGSVTGVVRSANGQPSPRVRVGLKPRAGNIVFDGRADDAGQYRIDGLPAGEYVVVNIWSGAFVDASVTVAGGAAATLDLTKR